MTPGPAFEAEPETAAVVVVRLWAAARAAAGAAEVQVAVTGRTSVAEVTEQLGQTYGDRLARVLTVCSVLLDEHPVSAQDPAVVAVVPGQTLDYLPPFAGG